MRLQRLTFVLLVVTCGVAAWVQPTQAQPTVSYEDPRSGAALITGEYIVATPFGATRDHTLDTSVQGIGLALRYYRGWYFAGASVSWQIFREERQAPQTDTGAQYEFHTTSLVPVLATGHYVWDHDESNFHSFVGVGLGGMMFRRKWEFLAESTTDTTWYTAYAIDGGGTYLIATGIALEAKARFVGGLRRGEKPPQMLQVSFGITFVY